MDIELSEEWRYKAERQCEARKRENSDVISDAYRRRYLFMKCTDKKLQKGLYRKPRLIAVQVKFRAVEE